MTMAATETAMVTVMTMTTTIKERNQRVSYSETHSTAIVYMVLQSIQYL